MSKFVQNDTVVAAVRQLGYGIGYNDGLHAWLSAWGIRGSLSDQLAYLESRGLVVADTLALHTSIPNGGIYVPADVRSLYQDSGGTTPVAVVTDPVGLCLDRSGHGNNLSQATPASKPTWNKETGDQYYLSFLGTDDYLTSGAGGGGTTGFLWCGVVKLTGGSATPRVFWSDAGANAGYIVRMHPTVNVVSLAAGNGATTTVLSSVDTLLVGDLHTVLAWDDGVNLNIQVDDGAVQSVGRPVVAAGTAGFTVGRNNGAGSAYLIGNIYSAAYVKNSNLAADERAALKTLVRIAGGL